jgi:hypothetical protein
MERDTAAGESCLLHWYMVQAGIGHHRLAGHCPGFLVISPPKTGSTWLAANLRCHSQLFVPDIKEVKYFSSFFKRMDLSWYLDNFRPGAGRLCGEASPSYALLPVERIRLIRRLMPEVKLIFLMRDPIARAWSHARHNHKYREANFGNCSVEFAAVPDEIWEANFRHDWPLASGDYLGQLRRWLSVFPAEQVYVGFYEAIAAAPERLLREIFAVLGVDVEVDFSRFLVKERILAGRPGELSPTLRRSLCRLLHGRTVELVSFLRHRFALEPPPEWQATLTPQGAVLNDDVSSAKQNWESQPEVFRRDLDDAFICRLLAHEEEFPSARCAVDEYRGYDIVYRCGLSYAFDQSLGPLPSEQGTGREIQPPPGFSISSWRANLRVEEFPEEQIRRFQDEGRCVIAHSLPELRARVDHELFRRLELRLQATAQETQQRIAILESRLVDAELALRRVEADLYPRPFYAAIGILRKIYRRLRAALLPT